MTEISIIIPVYQVEKYITKCIVSVLNQTLTDFELIIVDDGSFDDSSRICDEFANKDNRIVVIHQNNFGVSTARNMALDLASGEYIGFVDSDDWISPTMYEKMTGVMKTENVQLVCCQWEDITENGCIKNRDTSFPIGRIKSKDFIKHMYDVPRTFNGSNWNKLFCRSYITQRYENDISICEDNLFLTNYCTKIEYVVSIPDTLYFYLHRDASLSHANPNKLIEETITREKILNLLQGYDNNIENLAENEFLQCCLKTILCTSKDLKKENCDNAKKILRKYMYKNISHFLYNQEINVHTKILFIMIFLGFYK